jgi:hypothetical protein
MMIDEGFLSRDQGIGENRSSIPVDDDAPPAFALLSVARWAKLSANTTRTTTTMLPKITLAPSHIALPQQTDLLRNRAQGNSPQRISEQFENGVEEFLLS